MSETGRTTNKVKMMAFTVHRNKSSRGLASGKEYDLQLAVKHCQSLQFRPPSAYEKKK